MTARGEVLRGHGVVLFPRLRERVNEWAESQSPREMTFVFLAALTAILAVGLIVYGFCDVFETLRMSNLPHYGAVKPF